MEGRSITKKALILDDEEIARQFVRTILISDGCEVHEAEDDSEGLALAKVSLPDLVILDAQVPHMDGSKVFNELVNDPTTAVLPVIMLPGVSAATGLRFSPKEMGEFFGREAAASVEKPVDPQVSDGRSIESCPIADSHHRLVCRHQPTSSLF